MDTCAKCKDITYNTYLLYPKGEYPKKDNRIVLCGKCMHREKVIRVSGVSFELI